jgi:hypothetical protein
MTILRVVVVDPNIVLNARTSKREREEKNEVTNEQKKKKKIQVRDTQDISCLCLSFFIVKYNASCEFTAVYFLFSDNSHT